MSTYYLAITVDVCDHNALYEEMNEYRLESINNLEVKLAKYAKQDVAPIVELYECLDAEKKLIKKYRFTEYDCNC